MADEVKLLGVIGSPFSCRVEIALKLKGIPYEFIEEEDVYGKKSELLLKHNPIYKKIPVLFHNGKPILESFVIIEYLDEAWKENPILPTDPYEKALARFWAKFIDDKCMESFWKAAKSEGEGRLKAMEEAHEILKTLENELKGKKFFGGEKIGFLDIAATFLAFWLGLLQEASGMELLTKEKFPKLSEWTEEFLKCKAVQENLPPRERPLGLLKQLFGKA